MNAADGGPVEYPYRQFCDFVRRFDRAELLAAIARTALTLPPRVGEPGYAQTPPWALAAMVKASVCHGNPYRSTPVRPIDIRRGCFMHNNLRSGDNRSGYELSWSFPYSKRIKGLVQFFNGYGESMIDADVRTQRIGIGVLAEDWL